MQSGYRQVGLDYVTSSAVNGRISDTDYDDSGRVYSETDSRSNTTYFDYNNSGQKIATSVVNRPYQWLSKSELDAWGNPTSTTTLVREANAEHGDTYVTTVNQYNSFGELYSTSSPAGIDIVYTLYDTVGRMTEQLDSAGKLTKVVYTDLENGYKVVTTVSDINDTTLGVRVTTETHDSQGRLIHTQDAVGNVWKYYYNAQDLLVAIEEPTVAVSEFETASMTMHYTYNEQGVKIGEVIMSAEGYVTSTSADTLRTEYKPNLTGDIAETLFPTKRLLKNTFNAAGLPEQTFDGGQLVSTQYYDALGRVEYVDYPVLSYQTSATEHFTYHAATELVKSKTDVRGQLWQYEYDAQGNLEQTTNPDYIVTTQHTDVTGRLQTSTDEEGRIVKQRYDEFGRLFEVRDGNNKLIERNVYDAQGRLEQKLDGEGTGTRNEYNAFGEVAKTYDPYNIATIFTYDLLGNMASIQSPVATVSMATDYRGNITSQTNGEGKVTAYLYNGLGQLSEVQQQSDKLGTVSTKYFYIDGLLKQITNGRGYTRSFEHDSRDRVEWSINENNEKTQYVYDARGNLDKLVQPESGTTITYRYDAAGNPVNRSWRMPTAMGGQHLTDVLAYDAVGRKTDMYVVEGNGYISPTSVSQWQQHESWSLDRSGLPNTVTQATTGKQVSYTYDARGQVKTMTNPATGYTTVYTRDNRGNVTPIDHGYNLANGNRAETHIKWDDLGRIASRSLPNGTADFYFYDQVGRKQAVVRLGPLATNNVYPDLANANAHHFPDSDTTSFNSTWHKAVVADIQRVTGNLQGLEVHAWAMYRYDANNNVTARGINGQWSFHEYDTGLNQLLVTHRVAGSTIEFEWDEAGNLVRKTEGWQDTPYVYDQANRLTQEGQWGDVKHYTYDANGNMLTEGTGWLSKQFEYDAIGRLRQVQTQDGNNTQVVYDYDALERRIAAEFSSVTASLNWSTTAIYDGRQELAQFDQQGAPYRSLDYVPGQHGGQYGQLIKQTLFQPQNSEFANVRFTDANNFGELYYHQDMLGSTAGVSGKDGTGLMNWHYTIHGESNGYTHSGYPTDHTDATWNTKFVQPYLFTGRYTDALTDLTHMDARWYSAKHARFLQPDYYNYSQLSLPTAAQYKLLPYLGKNPMSYLRDPSQHMRYGYVAGNPLSALDWLGLRMIEESAPTNELRLTSRMIQDQRLMQHFVNLAGESESEKLWLQEALRRVGDYSDNESTLNTIAREREAKRSAINGMYRSSTEVIEQLQRYPSISGADFSPEQYGQFEEHAANFNGVVTTMDVDGGTFSIYTPGQDSPRTVTNTPNSLLFATGAPGYFNNSDYGRLKFKGPILPGLYVTAPESPMRSGVDGMRLWPHHSNDMRAQNELGQWNGLWRDDLWVHGKTDLSETDTGSMGCPIIQRGDRARMGASSYLVVY